MTTTTRQPSITVIMPAHNAERFLSEAIDSVLTQTFSDFELIIVENASTDSTLSIANRYQARDPRVTVIHSDTPGAALAINLGSQYARASWIARMDADDVWLPNKLERQWQFLQDHPNVTVVGTYGYRIGETGKYMSLFRAGPTTMEEFHRRRAEDKLIYLLSPSVLYSRSASEAVGGHDQSYAPAEDVEHWTRLADTGVVQAIPEPLVLYRIHSRSSSTSSFFTQIINAQRATENARRRRKGKSEFSQEEFSILQGQRPRLAQWREKRRFYSQYFYRRGGGELAAGRYSGLSWLLLSFLLSPALPLQRLQSQHVLQTIRGDRTNVRDRK